MRLTDTVEDYLKALLALTNGGEAAGTVALADLLGISAAAATAMLKRLTAAGLADHAPYHGVRLTRRGHDEAVRVVRRHRILETFLVHEVGYDVGAVHTEAERLEHAASDELIDAMSRCLGFPERDPHGSPIPPRPRQQRRAAGGTIPKIMAGALRRG
jgi:DtxR family Mn-dependent transcriptional regulator